MDVTDPHGQVALPPEPEVPPECWKEVKASSDSSLLSE